MRLPRFAALSVKAKISLGFFAVLVLHLSIAVLGHYGLIQSDQKMVQFRDLNENQQQNATLQRRISELQRRVLLFTHTGHPSQADLARTLYEQIDKEITQRAPANEADAAMQAEMREYLQRHRSLFDSIVEDRNRRRQLLDVELPAAAAAAHAQLNQLLAQVPKRYAAIVADIQTKLQGAELRSMRFTHGPDSQHIRRAKSLLEEARSLAMSLPGSSFAPQRQTLVRRLEAYENDFLQMVQATRGYLHLVNVVMAGESAEFDRTTTEYRATIMAEGQVLADELMAESRQFQAMSGAFSLLTIVLGIAAAGLINRAIGPPLDAVTTTLERLAAGTHADQIPGLDRPDEIGKLARAAEVFKTKIAEASAREELARRAAGIGTWDLDLQTGLVTTNSTLREMIGHRPGDAKMTTNAFHALIHPEDRPLVLAAHASLLERQEGMDLEVRVRCKDGGFRWVRTTGVVTDRAADGAALRIVGQHLDVQQTRDMLAAAEAANQAKSDFLANMSHEIRTPMTAILGFTDLLDGAAGHAPNDDMAADAIRTIRNNASHLMAIINDILDMSKIEAGRMQVEAIETRPREVLSGVVDLMRPRAEGKGIALTLTYDTPVPQTIQSDPTRLRQILLNLVGNAIKFTEVGRVRLHVACAPQEETLTVRVVDSGIGMDAAQMKRVSTFSAFSQADSTVTRKFGGTGLGLRISHSLATMLGGDIEVRSALGVGSTFGLTVSTGPISAQSLASPTAQQDGAAQPETSAPPSSDDALRGTRILLVEDGPDNQRLISFHLRRAGAEVAVVDNGQAAIDWLDTADDVPDVVLMDMQMPILDGYGATRALRASGFDRPIIAITAHAMGGDRKRCLRAGCSDYLTKPIDRNGLIETCLRWTSVSA